MMKKDHMTQPKDPENDPTDSNGRARRTERIGCIALWLILSAIASIITVYLIGGLCER